MDDKKKHSEKNRNIGGLDSRPGVFFFVQIYPDITSINRLGVSDHYSIFSTRLDEKMKILKKHGKPQPQVQYGST